MGNSLTLQGVKKGQQLTMADRDGAEVDGTVQLISRNGQSVVVNSLTLGMLFLRATDGRYEDLLTGAPFTVLRA
jgi:hypothetical protein